MNEQTTSATAALPADDVHPVGHDVRGRIVAELARIECEHDVRVLFACESGSRGWGFASPDSDHSAFDRLLHRVALGA